MKKKLNSEQIEAINHGNGPLLVIAGAGTGKTTVITERISHLITSGLAKTPEVLALTFTEKAAKEMEERVDVALPYGYTQMWISTFHSFCDLVLRREALAIGLDPKYHLMTTSVAIQLIRKNLFSFQLDYYLPLGNPTKFVGGLLQHFSRLQDEDIDSETYLGWSKKKSDSAKSKEEKEEAKKWKELANAYQKYDEIKVKGSLIDFGDLITKTLHLFRTRPSVLATYKKQFKYILVDEFQDTNIAQNELIKLLAGDEGNITVVADDDQSIYKWRGAAVSNVIQFRKNFPKTKIVTLTKNYRSTQEILDKAYDLIRFNNPDRLEVTEKIDKKLVSVKSGKGEKILFIHSDRVENEADLVTKNIRKLIDEEDYSYKDFAILVRANNYADPFLRSLARKGIPVQFLGPGQLFRQPEVRDLIAYLKVLNNYEDSASFFRVISMNHQAIPPRDLATIGNYARRFNLSLFEAAEKIEELRVDATTKEKVRKLLEMIGRHLGLIKKETAGQIVYYFLEDSNLLGEIANPDTVNAEKIAANISRFFDKLKTYEIDHEDTTVAAVLDWIDLAQEVGESPLAADTDWGSYNAVNILTVHSAKGLEFPVVFLVNLVGERFPTIERREQIPIPDALIKEVLPVGDYHLEEERRLFYVGMTRAKDRLYFTAANYYGEGKRQKRLSPFISEALGDEVLRAEELGGKGEQLSFLEYMKGKEEEKELKPQGIHIDYLSYSQIETFRICPLHYKLRYILKIPTPPSSSQSFGNSFHLTMKAFYEQIGLGLKPTKELITGLLKSNWIGEGYLSKSHETESFKKAERFLLYYLKNTFNPKRMPVATEIPFNVPIGGFRIGGKIDRVDILPSGEIEIIDYKTGAHPLDQKSADKDLQFSIYALAATEIAEPPFKRISPEKVKLSFYYFDDPKIVTTSRDKSVLEAAKKEIASYREMIVSSDFKCSGNYLCENCEYKEFCMDRFSEEKNG